MTADDGKETGAIRVAQICSSSATSGAENNVLQLSRTLLARGHQPSVVVPGPGWLPGALAGAGVPVQEHAMKGIAFYRLLGRLVREAGAGRLDLVHTHLTRAAYLGQAVGRLAQIPVVTSVHIANDDGIYRRLARGSNRIVAVSTFIADHLRRRGVPDDHLVTVPNATDMLATPASDREATRAGIGVPSEARVILAVGRVTKEKGIFELVAALAALPPDVILLLAGRSDPEYAASFDREIAALGVADRVRRLGVRSDVAALLDASDVLAMPSYMETFGMAALEAMARARPVVATAVGGLPEVVLDGETGILVPRIEGDGPRGSDPARLSGALATLLDDPALRASTGERGRERVAAEFTLEHMTESFEAVYRTALGRPSPA